MSGFVRHSIKFKLFAVISAIAFAFVSILTVLNVFFYDDYYTYQRRGALADLYRSVNRTFDGTIADLSASLEQFENTTGVRVSIVSAAGVIEYDSIFREQRTHADSAITAPFRVQLYDFPLNGATLTQDNLDEMKRQGYTFLTVTGSDSAGGPVPLAGFLALVGRLDANNALIVARVPLAYVEQNSSFNLTFLAITGLLTLAVCTVLAYVVSRQFTRPLIEIEEVATAMAELDFSKQYTGAATDEIGRLGQSINRLSAHLEQAIRALKGTNEELAHEIEEKERIDSMRREFIVNVSHELKTPLALIQGYAEGLRVGITASEDDREFYCDTIVDEAQHMNHLVMQLLDLSKLELGRETPERTEVDLYSLCTGVADKTAVLAAERGLHLDCTDTHAVLYADYGMLEQVVMNYVSNAIRYTPAGGRITLHAATEPDGAVTFAVENEGDPIAQGELGMIFEKFYRTDKARSRESGGSGIGLSIVRAIADAHGGTCGAENTADGVRFWFRVPAQPAP